MTDANLQKRGLFGTDQRSRGTSIARLAFALLLVSLAAAQIRAAGENEGANNAVSAASSAPAAPVAKSDHELVEQLLGQIDTLESRVKELESREEAMGMAAGSGASSPASAESVSAAVIDLPPGAKNLSGEAPPRAPGPPQMSSGGGHTMDIPGGPKLNIRGFLDFNFDTGSAANPLIYPLTVPPGTVHNAFQFGEFDLFMSSKLSNTISFVSEAVFGSDASNFWGIDIERAQLTYKANERFQLSAGRMHTAIGYYNTAYHHGTWFQTTTGRPYMFYYEDSGGILPVHIVGVSATGLIPQTGKLNLH
jgi:hypothetical protein